MNEPGNPATPPPPGPDGLPHVLRLPRRPKGSDPVWNWYIEIHSHQDEGRPGERFVVDLAFEGRNRPRPDSAPIFDTYDEAEKAAIRSALRLKTYVREK